MDFQNPRPVLFNLSYLYHCHFKGGMIETMLFVKFTVFCLVAVCLASAAVVSAQEPVLPQALVPGTSFYSDGPRGFLKPSKSINPPVSAAVAVTAPSIVQTPTAETRLRRLVVVSSTMTPEAIREAILACGQTRTPVTMLGGVNAPAPVLTDLAGLFGSTVTADTQKKVLETVRKGMGESSKSLKRVEIVGWLPNEGVMAVAVYPEG
ncbi:MAG: hypothetical protein ACKVY0_01185 [Prosthecobacter sp.]|uniref:hypothetical protein n=1 Tax=Prosthecobacter sp. TaxID=1965333 RepID=UPI00390334B4